MEGQPVSASRKRQRVGNGLTREELLASWQRCRHFLPQKRRFCNLWPSPGSVYCGNHRPPEEAVPERVLRLAGESADTQRVPCPVDPSHSVYKFNLEAHLKICNASKIAAEMEGKPYFALNCNSGSNQLEAGFAAICPEALAEKVERAYLREVLPSLEDSPAAVDSRAIEEKCIARLASLQTSFQRLRHVKQDAEIIAQLEHHGLFQEDTRRVFIELGAGKGKLGVSLAAAAPASRVVFIEREGQRRRADRLTDDDAHRFTRIRRRSSPQPVS